jgi:hypothetical protein
MAAVVSRERARTTYLTAAAGMLMLVAAFVMMVVAAPRLHARPHGPARSSVVEFTTDACRHLVARDDPAAAHGCLAGPPAGS